MTCVRNTTIFISIEYPGEPTNYKTLEPLDYVKIAFISFTMAGTLAGNFCVILMVAFNKTMKTVINIYMANLALADLLVCSICMTSFLWKNILNNHIFIFGPVMCKLIHFCQMITVTCSVLTLSAIACDRANAILFPLRNLKTKPRTKLVVTGIWLISIFVSIPLLFVRTLYTIHFNDFVQENCGDSWPQAMDEETGTCRILIWVPQLYYTFVSVTLFFLPASIMTVTYSLILWKMSKSPPGEKNEANLTTQNRNRKKIIKMVFTVLIVFMICWMPIQILVLFDKYRTCPGGRHCALPFWYEEAARVAEFLAYSNSFLNPLIYGGFNKEFRDNLWRYLKRCNKRKRRFGSSGIIQRFRTTLTTAVSSSLRKTSLRDPVDESKKRKEKAPPIAADEPYLCGIVEENNLPQVNEEKNDTAL